MFRRREARPDLFPMLATLRTATWWLNCAVAALAAATGCNRAAAVSATPVKAPEIEVKFVRPTEEVVTDFEEFNGRTHASETVDIRSRVSGYLDEVRFEDGAIVKEGELLFEIDPRSYKAEVERTAAALEQLQVRIERLRRQDRRAQQLILSNAISEEAFDALQSELNEAVASQAAATASHEIADLNLQFTTIEAPISGQISRRLVDKGNLVRSDDTLLATIVRTNPLHVYFDVSERTLLRLRRLQKQDTTDRQPPIEVQIALADESDFSHTATVDFTDNHVDPLTGTLRMRATLDNTQDLLAPGLFIRLRFPIGAPHPALLVPEEALATDQGQRCLYVIDDENKIAYRRVQVGILRQGRRVILDGIAATDRIVVTGLQRIRPGAKVIPKPAIETDEDKQALDSAPTSEASADHAPGEAATDDATTDLKPDDTPSTADDAKTANETKAVASDDSPQENSAARKEALSSDEPPAAQGRDDSSR